MMGTIVNAAAVAVGGLLGLVFKRGMKPALEESIHKALGIAVLVLGLNGMISAMITVSEDGRLSSSGELLLIVSLVAGMLVGELLRIDDRLNHFGQIVEQKVGGEGIAASFVSGTLMFCVGAMTIVGAINDGLYGDPSTLYVKSMLDGIAAVVFGATMGAGVCLCVVPILVYEGGLSLLAGMLAPYLQGDLLDQICMVGYAMVTCIGINFISKEAKIKTSNLLPALLVPILWTSARGLIG